MHEGSITYLSYLVDGVVGIIGIAGIFGARGRFLSSRTDNTIKYLTQENSAVKDYNQQLATANAQLVREHKQYLKRIGDLETEVARLQGMVRQTPEITKLTQLVTQNHIEMMDTITQLLTTIAGKEAKK